jgi:hypothetical protein
MPAGGTQLVKQTDCLSWGLTLSFNLKHFNGDTQKEYENDFKMLFPPLIAVA